MKYADCLPIFFWDPQKHVIGIVHSGWRGSLAEIGIAAVFLMEQRYRTKRTDILVAFGIGISASKYEVSIEFYETFVQNAGKAISDQSFIVSEGRLYFDNQRFNVLNFLRNAIPPELLFCNTLCTFEQSRFFSYRREKNNPGRNAVIIFWDSKL
jgi:YfiH family protein